MKLFCITGIDGAGKTTLALQTVNLLKNEGIRSVYIYGRTFPVISRGLMAIGRITLLHNFNFQQNYPEYNRKKKMVMNNRYLKWLYSITIYIDYYIQIWIKLLPQLLSRNVIILDRYIYDTVISDLAVHLNYSCEKAEQAVCSGLSLLPLPNITFLIDLPEEVAYSRKNDVPHIDYLTERRAFYKAISVRPEVTILDGTLAFEQISKNILSKIEANIG